MIHDSLMNEGMYRGCHVLFPEAFDWLLSFDEEMPEGRYSIRGESLFAMVQSYATLPPREKKWEAHRRYIDIQYVYAGGEVIYHAGIQRTEEMVAYDPERDVAFYRAEEEQALVMHPRDFAVFFPHDVHKPGCGCGRTGSVRKVVLKVQV